MKERKQNRAEENGSQKDAPLQAQIASIYEQTCQEAASLEPFYSLFVSLIEGDGSRDDACTVIGETLPRLVAFAMREGIMISEAAARILDNWAIAAGREARTCVPVPAADLTAEQGRTFVQAQTQFDPARRWQ